MKNLLLQSSGATAQAQPEGSPHVPGDGMGSSMISAREMGQTGWEINV